MQMQVLGLLTPTSMLIVRMPNHSNEVKGITVPHVLGMNDVKTSCWVLVAIDYSK
jgi:hypothetical protein